VSVTYGTAQAICGCERGPLSRCSRCDHIQELLDAKNGAYTERNLLVAALAKLFPASLERHPAEDEWDDDWRWIVFISLDTGQVSWHIHDSELHLFDHLPRETGVVWDGHTTDEKYARLTDLDWAREKRDP